MNRWIFFYLILVIFIISCTSGRLSVKKIDKISEKCKNEQLEKKPPKPKWQNLTTYQRNRKRREIEEYRKERISLYKAIYKFKTIYIESTDEDGNCSGKNCAKLERLRMQIVECCPEAGKDLPAVESK